MNLSARSLCGLSLCLVLAPAVAAPARAQDAVVRGDLGRRLDSSVTRAERAGFSGAVLVVSGGEVVLHRGAGVAVEEPRTPYARATILPIGSNTKDFTKTAILQLAEAGRLTLDDTVGRFFPDAPADKRPITVRQLLEHTAGLPLGVGSDGEAPSAAAWRQRLFERPLESAPGSARRYSNAGYGLLAAIVERVSGVPYERYVADHIFGPARMRETGLVLPVFDRARLAHAYAAGSDRGTMLDLPRESDGPNWNLRGNGGFVSTLEDMARFYRAILLDTALLRAREHRAMVVRPDEPTVLAGSDLVSFFLYGHFPGVGVEIFVASNHAAAQAPRLLDDLLPVLGIRQPQERRRRDDGPAPAPGARPGLPETGPGRTVAAYFEAYNSGDTAAMRRFFDEHALTGSGAPPMATRLDRFRQMFEHLGRITVENVAETADGLEVHARASNGDPVTLTFLLEGEAPFRLRGLRVEVG